MDARKPRNLWEMLLDWKALPAVFILFTISLNLIANSVYDLLLTLFAPTGANAQPTQLVPQASVSALITVVVTLAVIISVLLVIQQLRRIVQRWTADHPQPKPKTLSPGEQVDEAFLRNRRGLVFSVGLGDYTIRYALYADPEGSPDAYEFRPHLKEMECIGLVCSELTKQVAEKVAQEFASTYARTHPGTDIKAAHELRTRIASINDTSSKDCAIQTELLLNWMRIQHGLGTDQLAVDVTGGKKTMSMGLSSMADDQRVDQQYIDSEYSKDRKPIQGSQKAILPISFSNNVASVAERVA